jgi:subtilase family serine protease
MHAMVRKLLIGIAVGLIGASLVASTASAATGRRTLAGSIPTWANAANARGAVNSSAWVGFRVYLGLRDQAGAEAVARAVSDPRSSQYGHYLTPAQFRQRFAATQVQVGAVQSWLRSQGFKVGYTPSNNRFVTAEGTVAQASAAFATSFQSYSVKGKVVRSPSRALSLPASLSFVTGVIGLDDATVFAQHVGTSPAAPPSPAFVNAPPCSAYWGQILATTVPQAYGATQPYAPCGYTPQQLRGAYGTTGLIADGIDGSGQTVAIVDAYASPTIVQDVNQWSTNRGIPTLQGGQFRQVVPPGIFNKPQSKAQDPQGWYGEETLDVEAVHAMAPGANIVYVGAPNNYRDLDALLNHIVDFRLARIVSNSYGYPTELLPPGFVKPINDTFIQAAAEGIGFYFASGDGGDEIARLGFRSVDWPPASPWVTAVGGTALGVGANNQYLFETGWGTKRSILTNGAWTPTPPGTFLSGGGGGASCLFPQPSYQVGIVPNSISEFSPGRVCGTFKGRAVPDVAMDGEPSTGFLVGQTQTFPDGSVRYSEYRLGGTSLSSPLFAGIMALADQAAGTPHGFANPALYAAAGTSAYHDIVDPASTIAAVRNDYKVMGDTSSGITTSLRTFNQTGTLHTRPGYDDVTGVGSPNGADFINALK